MSEKNYCTVPALQECFLGLSLELLITFLVDVNFLDAVSVSKMTNLI